MSVPEVKVGQHWKDMDKRMNGRTVRVESINDGHGYSSGVPVNYQYAICIVGATSKKTRIRIDRLNGRLWKLVRDENGKRVEEET